MVDLPPMPDRIVRRPRDHRGYPVPWFVLRTGESEWDFRVMDQGKWFLAIKHKLCWVCGEPLGRFYAFVIGPMCAVNRITSEPAAHLDCALWSVKACPFLTRPRMKRNTKDMPEGVEEPGGIALYRNPGCVVIWVTRKYSLFTPHRANNKHPLISIGEPEGVTWWIEGKQATRDEVEAVMASGIVALREMCALEETPGERKRAFEELERQYAAALQLIPKAA